MKRSRRPLRFAVVGLSHFAREHVLPAIDRLPDVELAALVSGSPDKLRTLGEQYDVEDTVSYDDFERLLAEGRIDVAYIAVPNDMHADFAIRAARHGVHVLCEKPMAPSEEECVAMMRACRHTGVKLMIAYRLHFEAANLQAIGLARDGGIGIPQRFSSRFTMQRRDGDAPVRRGSGPLYDFGVYCINAARYLFKREPYEVEATPSDGDAIAVTLRFPDDRTATFVASYGEATTAQYELVSTDATLVLDQAEDLGETMRLTLTRDGTTRTRTVPRRDQVGVELEYFARCIREDLEPEPSAEDGLADVRVILAIERAARTGRAVAIDPVALVRRPEPEQLFRVPMSGTPRLADVETPTR